MSSHAWEQARYLTRLSRRPGTAQCLTRSRNSATWLKFIIVTDHLLLSNLLSGFFNHIIPLILRATLLCLFSLTREKQSSKSPPVLQVTRTIEHIVWFQGQLEGLVVTHLSSLSCGSLKTIQIVPEIILVFQVVNENTDTLACISKNVLCRILICRDPPWKKKKGRQINREPQDAILSSWRLTGRCGLLQALRASVGLGGGGCGTTALPPTSCVT